MSKKKSKKEAPKEYRTIEGDFKKIIIILLELSQAGDCEMFNMGDWSMEDLVKNSMDKDRAIKHLQDGGKLADVPAEVLAEAYHTFKTYYRATRHL